MYAKCGAKNHCTAKHHTTPHTTPHHHTTPHTTLGGLILPNQSMFCVPIVTHTPQDHSTLILVHYPPHPPLHYLHKGHIPQGKEYRQMLPVTSPLDSITCCPHHTPAFTTHLLDTSSQHHSITGGVGLPQLTPLTPSFEYCHASPHPTHPPTHSPTHSLTLIGCQVPQTQSL